MQPATIELLMDPTSLSPDLRLTGTIPGVSALSGTVTSSRLSPPPSTTIRSITVGNGVANKLASNIKVKSILPDPSIVDQLLDGSLTPTGLLAGV